MASRQRRLHHGGNLAGNPQDTILNAFNQALGNPASSASVPGVASGLLPGAEQSLSGTLSQVAQAIGAQTQATTANTDALAQEAQAKSPSGLGGAVSSVLNTASQFLGGGLSVVPIISLFSSLLGGGQPEQPAPLVPFSLPPSLNLESTTQYQEVVWGETGMPSAAGRAAPNAPQITVQVQAIDSRSFLDHSSEIAQAVRQAMLNMNALNDVVTNL